MDFTAHGRAQGRVDHLVARQGSFASKLGSNDHGLKMGVIVAAHDGPATGEPGLNLSLNFSRSHSELLVE
jgi:hypothetical protein